MALGGGDHKGLSLLIFNILILLQWKHIHASPRNKNTRLKMNTAGVFLKFRAKKISFLKYTHKHPTN